LTQITLSIKDSKLGFFMELIRNFSFVKVDHLDDDEPTKEEIKENIRRGLRELKLIEEGKLETRPAKEFLNEL
jgi:hypothetical protein